MSDPTAALERIFADVIPDDAVPPRRRTRVNCTAWDSVAQINLVLSIEQELGVTLTETDAVDLTSFDAAVLIVRERLNRP